MRVYLSTRACVGAARRRVHRHAMPLTSLSLSHTHTHTRTHTNRHTHTHTHRLTVKVSKEASELIGIHTLSAHEALKHRLGHYVPVVRCCAQKAVAQHALLVHRYAHRRLCTVRVR